MRKSTTLAPRAAPIRATSALQAASRAAAGEPGACRAIAILKDELVRTMQLCGARTTHDIDASLLFSAKL